MKSLKAALLQENPDVVTDDRGAIITSAYRNQAHPFGIWKGKLYVGDLHGTHGTMIHDEARRRRGPRDGIMELGDIEDNLEAEGFPTNRGLWTYPGRIWKDLKIISFWEQPTRTEFFQILDELDKLPLVNTRDGEWKVDTREEGLVPVEEYGLSGEVTPAPFSNADHVKPPMEKPRRIVPDGMGSKKNLGPLPVKTNFYRNLSEALLTEMADSIFLLGDEAKKIDSGRQGIYLYFSDPDAYAFLYDGETGGLYISDPGKTHGSIRNEHGAQLYRRGEGAGRVWIDRKVISFWNYPKTQSELRKVVQDLEKKRKIKIWSQGWWIEEPNDQNGPSFLSPLEQYLRPSAPDPTYRDHEESPLSKLKRTVPDGIGSKKYRGALPAKTNYDYSTNIAESIITESPDSFTDPVDGKLVVFDTGDSYPFVYALPYATMLVGKRQGSHFYVWADLEKAHRAGESEFGRDDLDKDDIVDGRIWTDRKVISFWYTPEDRGDLEEIVEALEKKLRIRIFNNGYRLDAGWNRSRRLNDMVSLDSSRVPKRNKPEELPPDRRVWAPPELDTRVKGRVPLQARERSLVDLYR